jgi:L-ascorbate oxidase
MRSTILGKRLYGVAALTAVLVCWTFLGLAPSEEPKDMNPAKANEAAKPKGKAAVKQVARNIGRRKRAPSLPIQMDRKLALKSKADFYEPYQILANKPVELSLTTSTFANKNPDIEGSPTAMNLLCYQYKDEKGLAKSEAVGPTIVVERGAKFTINLNNQLAAVNQFPLGPTLEDFVPPNPKALKPMDLCATNLHTHGLHVSPKDPSDNVFRSIAPGENNKFTYTIPIDHPAGTFWYHPHLHGSVAYQLSNGVAGALIVKGGGGKGKIKDLEDVPGLKGVQERVMVFQLYTCAVDKNNVARIDANQIYNVTPDTFNCPKLNPPDSVTNPQEFANLNLGAGTFEAVAINGVLNPTIPIAQKQLQRWRLVHAGWDRPRQLVIVDSDGQPATDIWFHEIAVDGLATGRMEKKINSALTEACQFVTAKDRPLDIAPGQRSDVLILGPVLNDGEKNRSYNIVAIPTPDVADPTDQTQWQTIATIEIRPKLDGKNFKDDLPNSKDFKDCQPFETIDPANKNKDKKNRELPRTSPPTFPDGTLFFSADDDNPDKNPPPKPARRPHYTIGNMTFGSFLDLTKGHNPNPKPTAPIQIKLNTWEEWQLIADSNAAGHPFHIHVNPFQVINVTCGCDTIDLTDKNIWRDTLYLPQGTKWTIRSRFQDHLGLTVLHCHILDHEDQGMMIPIEFIPANEPVNPKAKPKQVLKPCAALAPALKLPTADKKPCDLAEFRGRNVVLVFFQGADCIHCVEELRELVREARGQISSDPEIVAISSRKIDDQSRAFKVLGVAPSDRFHLLVDEGHSAFRAFDCYDKGPMHGMFLIDQKGVVRAGYTGESPFSDAREVVRRARKLGAAGLQQGE